MNGLRSDKNGRQWMRQIYFKYKDTNELHNIPIEQAFLGFSHVNIWLLGPNLGT